MVLAGRIRWVDPGSGMRANYQPVPIPSRPPPLQGRCTAQAYGVVQQIGPVAVPVFIALASAAEAADLDAQSEHSSSAET